MFEVTSAKVKRAIRKGAKRQEKQNKAMPFLNPSTVSLEKWLELYQGDTSRLDWLYSELLEYADENESAGNSLYMRMDKNGIISFHLDEIGVFWFSDILQEFFSLQEVRQMQQYLKSENAIVRFFHDLQTAISGMDTDSLKEYRQKWEHIQGNSDTAQKAKQNVFKLIDTELKKRKGLIL